MWLTKNILDHNKAHPDKKLKFPAAIDLHKLLVVLVKSENPWYYECSKSTPQQALRLCAKLGSGALTRLREYRDLRK
ncbi:hypothetical protein QT982_33525, partial [Microcoleus sp. herbarium2]